MENLLESNERTLIMLDAVHAGLSECLSLVHADIRQMTEHRNKLAQIEHEQIQAKLIPANQLLSDSYGCHVTSKDTKLDHRCISKNQNDVNENSVEDFNKNDDPHHLAGLKLLDKRLADSFSEALSMNDLHNTSLLAKHRINQTKPSIFNVLLGKPSKSAKSSDDKSSKKSDKDKETDKIDNKTIIDDINKQTRLAMQYSKQLESHLLKVEDLKAKYEMHLKMGLVVKDVSRAYLLNGAPGSPSSNRHSSSFVMNDSGSIGAHSSVSSLNLSTWSSSRSKSNKRASGLSPQTCNPNYSSSLCQGNQAFVSTLSLNSKNNRRLNISKLISPKGTLGNEQQYSDHQYSDAHYCDLESPDSSHIRHRVSSHSVESPHLDKYAYGADWLTTPERTYTCTSRDIPENSSASLSRSHVNLNASRLSLKSSRSKSVSSAKGTIKEFIENIDKIESEFENYMGSFLLSIEDIQGFARICPGDVFEITIKYGDAHKFKTKISVMKDNKQKCDNRQTVFKARIADILAIKACECKGLGKRVLLGHKLCETRDLFTARSQLMTISLNQTGSIKLNMIVTWNPLHMAPSSVIAAHGLDISHISLPPTPASSSTLSSLSSVPSSNGAVSSATVNVQTHVKPSYNRSPNSSMGEHHHARVRRSAHDSMYQTVDPTYGYYIPPPDYITNETG